MRTANEDLRFVPPRRVRATALAPMADVAAGDGDGEAMAAAAAGDEVRSAEGLTFEQWEAASWAAIDAIELELGDDALALQRKAKARRRRESLSGGTEAGQVDGGSGWHQAATPTARAPSSATDQVGAVTRAPVAFGLAKMKKKKKKPAKVSVAARP